MSAIGHLPPFPVRRTAGIDGGHASGIIADTVQLMPRRHLREKANGVQMIAQFSADLDNARTYQASPSNQPSREKYSKLEDTLTTINYKKEDLAGLIHDLKFELEMLGDEVVHHRSISKDTVQQIKFNAKHIDDLQDECRDMLIEACHEITDHIMSNPGSFGDADEAHIALWRQQNEFKRERMTPVDSQRRAIANVSATVAKDVDELAKSLAVIDSGEKNMRKQRRELRSLQHVHRQLSDYSNSFSAEMASMRLP